RGGFAVPAGCVVATAASAAVVAAAGLDVVITRGLEAGDDAAIRAAFEAVTVPDALVVAIAAAHADLGGGPVAVRSSATAEDLPGAAFAGQQDTFLNVVGAAAVLDAMRRCWGSLWTARAIAYRARRGVARDGLRIAVVVQRMIDAEFAGVLFTANPVTGERSEVVVDASAGLGESVVSGLVTPDHHVLGADGAVLAWTPGRREVVIRAAAGGGVIHDTDAPDPTPLPAPVLRELAAQGRAVAAHFSRPQDIEWAYAHGRVWLVQARPMTALPPPPLRLGRLRRAAGLQLLDYMSVRPYPLDVSAWIEPGIGRMVQRMLAEIPGLHVDLADVLPEVEEVVDRFVPPLPRPTRAMFTAPARIALRIRRFDPATWTADERFVRFDRQVRELDRVDVGTLGWAELVASPRRALAAAEVVTDLRVDYLPRTAFDLVRLMVVLALLRRGALAGPLTAGAATRTGDANRALDGLADLLRTDPRLAGLDDDALAADPRFGAALAVFRAEYGHRETVSPLLMTAPTWGEAPGTVLGLVRVLAQGEPAAPGAGERALRGLLAHRLVRATRSGPRLCRMVEAARAGIALREDTHFHGTRVLPVLRRALLEAGARLAAAGVLGAAEDVVHLRLDEIEAVADPDRLPAAEADRLREAARRRAARRAELAGVPMIAAATLRPPAADDADALTTGVPASGGRATGPVRVVRSPAEFGTMRSGDVLVCPYTNPSWTPLFQRAAAVVVDSGGLGSHAAIVAREYGIPAVMGTGTGTPP
ncbi:MAG: phosphoenolpyruvate synthase, partial [Pseudonocardia sp.]|nr:phosphoenolpyruvate synthase [Pseudonocardia sp.]